MISTSLTFCISSGYRELLTVGKCIRSLRDFGGSPSICIICKALGIFACRPLSLMMSFFRRITDAAFTCSSSGHQYRLHFEYLTFCDTCFADCDPWVQCLGG